MSSEETSADSCLLQSVNQIKPVRIRMDIEIYISTKVNWFIALSQGKEKIVKGKNISIVDKIASETNYYLNDSS